MQTRPEDQILLVIAPHPDDEILGCGGLISKVKKMGGKVYVLYVTVGDAQQYGGKSSASTRIREMEEVVKFMRIDGYDMVLKGDDYHLKLDTVPQRTLIDLIEKDSKVSINKIKPTIVAFPCPHYFNQDHRAVFNAGFAACRPRPRDLKHAPNLVLSYEQPEVFWSDTPFKPNLYVDISKEIDKKIDAIKLYSSQVHTGTHPRTLENIKNIAQLRGKDVGVEYAESFIIHRFLLE